MHEPVFQIGLMADGIRSAHHGVLRLQCQICKRLAIEDGANHIHEERRIIAPRQDPNTLRIIRILIEDTVNARSFHRRRQRGCATGIPEHQQMHKQALV